MIADFQLPIANSQTTALLSFTSNPIAAIRQLTIGNWQSAIC